MKRLLATAAVLCVFGAAATSAHATNECKGLQTCVPVVGPWVLAPAASEAEFQLSCPRRFIVGGLDAELSDPGVEVGFVGTLGSPVNPGITTSTAAMFLGRLVHRGNTAASFRPHIGCIPASGGGQRVPTAFHPFPPGRPSIVRVVQFAVHPGRTQRVVGRCSAQERIAAATFAVGFYTAAPPTAALARGISVRRRAHPGGVLLVVRSKPLQGLSNAIVQLDLTCVAT